MAVQKLTAEQVQAIDWAALFNKAGPIVAALLQAILQSILTKQQVLKAGGMNCPDCPDCLKDACEEECEALVTLVTAHCVMHGLICPDDKC